MTAEMILISHSESALEEAKACARAIARALSATGMQVKEQITVCSGRTDSQKAVAAALKRSSIVLTLGGLDRESGGIAKMVVAQGLSLPIETDEHCLRAIEDYCRRSGEEFLPGDAALAQIPQGARAFPGKLGKIPALMISSASQHIALLPGTKREALPLFTEDILPVLNGTAADTAVTRVLRTYGVSEDMVRRALAEVTGSQNPTVSIEKERGEVLVLVTGTSRGAQKAASVCTPALRKIVELLGDAAYGLDVESLQAAVVEKLKTKELGLAIAESGSGGMLTRMLSETRGGAEILRYSVAADTDKTKWEKLKLPYKLLKKHGGCSEQAVVYLADAARRKAGASLGVSLSVGQGYDHKNPLGLVYIAVCDAHSVYVKKLIIGDGFPEEQDLVLDAALSRTLNMIRLFVDYLPGAYMGAIPLDEALEGRTVTDLPGYDARLDTGETKSRVPWWKRLGRHFLLLKTDRPGVKVRKVILILAILVFLASGAYIGKHYLDAYNAKKLAGELVEMYTHGDSDQAEPPDDFPEDYLDRFGALYAANPDVVGFLSLEGTPLAYPVVQGEDNEYYLRRDYNRRGAEHGIPFMDYRVDVQRPSENMVIYGHNMKDGQLFGELIHYNTRDKNIGADGALAYFKEHPVIDFSTVYEENEYAIFSIFITNGYDNQGPVFDYHNFIDAKTQEDLLAYAHQLKIRSLIDTKVDIQPEDELITLSTCTYEFTDARFVVVARRLRPGETRGQFGQDAVVNPTPLMPDVWYELFGGSKPTGLDSGASVTTSPATAPSSSVSSSLQPLPAQPDPPTVTEARLVSSSQPESSPAASSPPESSPAPVSSVAASSSVAEVSVAPPPQALAASTQEVSEESSEEELWIGEEGEDEEEEELQDELPQRIEYDGELSVTAGGRVVSGDALDIVARIVQNEVGASFHTEAIKAQAVAAFSFVSFYNQGGTSPAVAMAARADQKVINAVSEVIGEAVWYQGKLALTPYHATSAGATANSRDVWGGHYAYLVSVDSDVDTQVRNYSVTKTMTSGAVYDLLEQRLGISPDGDPGDWFEIVDYLEGGYVGNMRVGGVTTAKNGTRLTGRYLRESVLGLRSACFDVQYKPDTDKFTFTSYGYGHGVGMSQNGANLYAGEGWSYIDILTHYYPGTQVG